MKMKTKLILIIVLGFISIPIIMVTAFGTFLYNVVDNHIEENNRIAALPELTGVLVSDNDLLAPISGDSVAYFQSRIYVKFNKQDFSSSRSSQWNSPYIPKAIILVQVDSIITPLSIKLMHIVLFDEQQPHSSFSIKSSFFHKPTPEIPKGILGISGHLDGAINQIMKNEFHTDLGLTNNKDYYTYGFAEMDEWVWHQGDSISFKGQILDGQINLLH
jgi:hypothetical protein